MMDRTNDEWLAALDTPGPDQAGALDDLRSFLVRGLGYAMADRPSVTGADIEGFVQNALLKILDNLASFRGESRFTTWAQKIAVHEALGELRRKRWEDVSLDDLIRRHEGDFVPSILADSHPSPEHRVERQALVDMLKRSIAEDLTERQRRALIAVALAGMPAGEVARRMGTNRNALYKLLHDARQRLKRRLVAEGVSAQDAMATLEPVSR